MMYPRLMLARSFISPDGFIVVSVDEHEIAHLIYLLGIVFGQENEIAQIAVSLNPKGRHLAPYFATSHEYILLVARDIGSLSILSSSADAVDAADFPLKDDKGNYRLLPLRNTNKKFHPQNRPNLAYKLFGNPDTGKVGTERSPGAHAIMPVFGTGLPAVWRWSKPKAKLQADDLLCRNVGGRLGKRVDVFQKDYLSSGRVKKLKTVWVSSEVGSTDGAVLELQSLVGASFPNPKPTKFVKSILALAEPNVGNSSPLARYGSWRSVRIGPVAPPDYQIRFATAARCRLIDARSKASGSKSSSSIHSRRSARSGCCGSARISMNSA